MVFSKSPDASAGRLLRRPIGVLAAHLTTLAILGCSSPTNGGARTLVPACVGPYVTTPDSGSTELEASVYPPDAGTDGGHTTDAGDCPAPCLGQKAPSFRLRDRQPASCGYHASYGLEAFRGAVTVVVALSGWCGYCVEAAGRLEALRLEMNLAHRAVHFVALSTFDAAADVGRLTSRCSFAVLEDTAEQNVVGMLGLRKDDVLVYDAEGNLAAFIPSDGTLRTNLTAPEGMETLRQAVLAALK